MSHQQHPGGQSAASDCPVCGDAQQSAPLRGGGWLARCGRCGHLTRDLSTAPAWHRDEAYGGDPRLDRARLWLTYRTLQAQLPRAPRRVFEIGYGAGSLLRLFLDGGAQVAGCDPDQLQIGVDPKVADHGTLLRGGIEQWPEVEGTLAGFDLVYSVHVLEHLVDPVAALRATAGLLAPGGVAQFLTPAGDSRQLRRFGSAWWMLEDPTHVGLFTADSLRLAAESAGFQHVRIRRPWNDSLSVEVASLVRALRPRSRAAGVLRSAPVIPAVTAALPVTIPLRWIQPSWRPTLHLVAQQPTIAAAP